MVAFTLPSVRYFFYMVNKPLRVVLFSKFNLLRRVVAALIPILSD